MKLESNRIYNNLVKAWTARNYYENAMINGHRLTAAQEAEAERYKKVYKNYLNALNKEKRNLGLYSNKNKINNAAKKVNAYRQGKQNSLNQLRKNYRNRSSQEYLRKKGQLNRNYDALIKRSRNNLNRLLAARNTRKRTLNRMEAQARSNIQNQLRQGAKKRRKVSTIHQLGSILPRNVLEQVIRRANLLN